MKKLVLLISTALLSLPVFAADYQTAGDGTAYTLESLSKIEASGVKKDGTTYTMLNNVTIAAGDEFTLEGGATVKMGDDVTLQIEGKGNFDLAEPTLVTRNLETDKPAGIYFFNSDTKDAVVFRNLNFEYAGLAEWATTSVTIDKCSFKYNNGVLKSTGALSLGNNGATYTVTNCEFIDNEVGGIVSSATMTGGASGLVLDNCKFENNLTATKRMNSQVNVVVAGELPVEIRNCTVIGSQSKFVGGISIMHAMPTEGANKVVIENNEIRDNCYGIAIYGGMDATVKNNRIISNKYASTPMEGGSGITINNYTGKPNMVVTGNHIEDNLWGVTVIGGENINFGKVDDESAADYNPGGNVFVNNGNTLNGAAGWTDGGKFFPYDLCNNTSGQNEITVYAQGNTWSVDEQTAEKIETVIFHKTDNQSLGEVIYMPEGEGGVESVAAGLEAYFNGKQLVVSADANVEVYNLSGAKVAEYAGESVIDLSGLAGGIYVARVAADGKVATVKCAL